MPEPETVLTRDMLSSSVSAGSLLDSAVSGADDPVSWVSSGLFLHPASALFQSTDLDCADFGLF
jgi:hypothetical protein